MNNEFHQIIYHSPNSTHNTPGVTADGLISGAVFSDYGSISQLGVRALPGTKFYINGNTNPVLVGFIGLFEIDLTNGGSISELRFNEKSIRAIEANDSAYLIVDILTMGGE